jgi:LuxR family maltose regulon positive regulatory protein
MAQILSPTAIVDALINELVRLEIPMVIVLDDYHTITNPALHESLDYFIEHQPAHVHLVMTTREGPPLPLARLRTRRQMTEIRAHHLRFTLDEARQFFNQSIGFQSRDPMQADRANGITHAVEVHDCRSLPRES